VQISDLSFERGLPLALLLTRAFTRMYLSRACLQVPVQRIAITDETRSVGCNTASTTMGGYYEYPSYVGDAEHRFLFSSFATAGRATSTPLFNYKYSSKFHFSVFSKRLSVSTRAIHIVVPSTQNHGNMSFYCQILGSLGCCIEIMQRSGIISLLCF
jgi:hypothetical protein